MHLPLGVVFIFRQIFDRGGLPLSFYICACYNQPDNDSVMNRVKYDENKANLPRDYTEIIIDGGCHAYFGMYGTQDGDGKPAISNEKQISLTAEHILKMMEQ